MAQQLKVFQDPSIVKNVPQTDMERLQLALEAKAARRASGQESGILPYNQPTPQRSPMDPVGTGGGSYGNLVGLINDPIYGSQPVQTATRRTTNGTAGSVAMPANARPASVDRAFAQMAQQPSPSQSSAIASVAAMGGKNQSRLAPTDFGGPKKQPPLDTSGMIARNLDPYTNAYGSPLQSTAPNAALSAISGALAPQPMPGRPMALSSYQQNSPSSFTPIQKGSGDTRWVTNLQSRLNELGYNSGRVDGIFGNKTDAAVRAFQKANGLKVDGIVGRNTIGALQNSSYPSLGIPAGSQTAVKTSAPVRGLSAIKAPAKPSGYGLKGLSAEGKALQSMFRRKK